MFINSINLNSKVNLKNQQSNFKSARSAQIAENKMKILIAQDIKAPKLAIKLPESSIEKKALLEILFQRLKLDRLIRLTNERFDIISDIIRYNELQVSGSNSEEAGKIKDRLDKKGNIKECLATLNKQIKQESKRNKGALNYFEELSNLEDEYYAKKIIKDANLEKFWIQVRKNNINPEGKYSTKELIEFVKNDHNPIKKSEVSVEQVEVKQPETFAKKCSNAIKKMPCVKEKVNKPVEEKLVEEVFDVNTPVVVLEVQNTLSPEYNEMIYRYLLPIGSRYETLLRENVNLYLTADKSVAPIVTGMWRKACNEHASIISGNRVVNEALSPIGNRVIDKFYYIVKKIMDNDININVDVKDLFAVVESCEQRLYKLDCERNELKQMIAKESQNVLLEQELEKIESEIVETREQWTQKMLKLAKSLKENKEIIISSGFKDEYEYIFGINHHIKKYEKAFDVYQENNSSIPESYWQNLIKGVN